MRRVRPFRSSGRGLLVLVLLAASACGGADGGAKPAAADDDAGAVREDVASSASDTADAADAAGEPPVAADLVDYARLWADGTRGFSGLPWPREARDALATVRDGHDATGWKPLVDEPSVATIDLGPLAGGPVALGPLALSFEGAPPADVTVALAPGCGLAATETLAWDDPRTPLELSGRTAGCVSLTLTGGADLVVHDLSLANADPRLNDALAPPPDPAPGERDPESGVIEGFYGVPWAWSERRAMVRQAAALGLGAYLYAPKDDPLHRDRWREPYDDSFRESFASLARSAETFDVALLFGISPFLDYDFEGAADYETLRDKVLRFLEDGAAGVALLADDIEWELEQPVDGDLGALHVDVANRLLADLTAAREGPVAFWFVPTAYSDDRADGWDGGQAYLEALAQLDPRIRILWTGPDTGNDTMTAGDMDRFRDATGREPLIWDNFWANDGGDGLFGRIVLDPYSGRAGDLPGAVEGVAQNLSIQGGLSRWALATFAAWRGAPATYDEAAGFTAAGVAALAHTRGAAADPERDAALVRRVMQAFRAHGGGVPVDPSFEDAVTGMRTILEAHPETVPVAEARTALAAAVRLATLDRAVHHSGLATDVVDELIWPLARVRHEADAAVATLWLLGERLAGREGAAAGEAADAELRRAASDRFAWGTGGVARLLAQVRDLPTEDRGFVPVPATPATPGDACRAGEPIEWTPFEGADELHVGGLPRASVEGDRIRWTPPHAARYVAVVAALRIAPPGWSVRRVAFLCSP